MSKNTIKTIGFSVIGIGILVGLFFLSQFNYLLFHFVIEFLSIIIGVSIFIIIINTLYLTKSSFLLFLGATFLTVSSIDFLHTLAYKGVNIFTGFDSDLPTQLWISSRYLQAICLFIAVFLISKKVTRRFTSIIAVLFTLIFTGLILITFYTEVFPSSYVEGDGLTRFKIISEYIIIAILIGSIIVYTMKRKLFKRRLYYFLLVSIISFIMSELFFTFYIEVYDFYNMLGHLLKVVSFFYFYKLFIEINLKEPLELFFKEIDSSNKNLEIVASTDQLTGLSNRYYLFKKMETQYMIAKRFSKDFSVITIDIDSFKKINDLHGHPFGDKILKNLAVIIENSVRGVDIKGRIGGDEFIICPIETDISEATKIADKIQKIIQNSNFKYTVSIGISGLSNDNSLENIIYDSDQALLQSKKFGKNKITTI
ncbi:MAG: GGDEF domain-containing protein [Candidatus Humimicrobiaceae bacterium]